MSLYYSLQRIMYLKSLSMNSKKSINDKDQMEIIKWNINQFPFLEDLLLIEFPDTRYPEMIAKISILKGSSLT